jgi:hypothetical protein
MADRGGWIQPGVEGLQSYRHLGRAPLPFLSVKLKHLGHIGKQFADYYGDEVTWDQLGSLQIPWGNSTTIKYAALQPGWTYWWEIGTWDFTVTDELGNATVEKVKTLSDLGITWEIFESHQFSIHISGKFENDAFLIAWRYRRGTDGDWYEPPVQGHMMPYLWGEFEKYLLEYIHIEHRRLVPASHAEATDVQYIDADVTGLIRSLVFAYVAKLSATGDFPAELLAKDINTVAAKVLENKKAESYIMGQLLMIQTFASINHMSKPVYEPWMLWYLWQWMGKSSVVVSRERVFDLSPWWG